MIALLCFFLRLLASPFKSMSGLEAEDLALRQQLIVVLSKNSIRRGIGVGWQFVALSAEMLSILHTLRMFVTDFFKPRWRLQAENLLLRHQLGIALRQAPRGSVYAQ